MSRSPRKFAILIAGPLAAALTSSACGSGSGPSKDTSLVRAAAPASRPVASQSDLDATAAGSAAFGLDLFHTLTAADGNANIMISPASVTSVLGMLLPGAHGTTADEMAKVLHTSLPADRYAIAVGALNAAAAQRAIAGQGAMQQSDTVWAQKDYGIQQRYLDTL